MAAGLERRSEKKRLPALSQVRPSTKPRLSASTSQSWLGRRMEEESSSAADAVAQTACVTVIMLTTRGSMRVIGVSFELRELYAQIIRGWGRQDKRQCTNAV